MFVDDSQMREILRTTRTIAVVGLSDKPDRDSHHVAAYLQRHGYRIIPVNPAVKEVLGEKAYARLEDVPDPIDVVDVFRRPDAVPEVVASAVADQGEGALAARRRRPRTGRHDCSGGGIASRDGPLHPARNTPGWRADVQHA